jgi:quinoprotein glucose dehydrogenase
MPANPDLTGEQVAALVAFLQAPPPAVPAVAPGGAHGGETAPPAAPPSSAPASRYRFTGYRKFLDPDGYPAVAPPWGTLNAIDLNTGEYRWSVPLGEYPELAARGVPTTGTENYGGPIVTASGLVFIGATNYDKKFRAFDAATGKVLWEAVLPFSGNATPATYAVGGRQFVVIPAGGGRPAAYRAAGVAFALPK